MKWVKDAKAEANMRALGIPFSAETVPLEQVDLEEGLKRQARLIGRLNEEWAIQMSLKMAEPEAAFPMTILQRPPRGKLWPWSGNHRLAAFGLAHPGATHIDAYVVTLKDPVMLDVFPRVVNVWESGIGFSRDEKVMNARWCIENHSMSTAEAAAMFGVKPDWIYKANAAAEVRKLTQDIPKADSLAKNVLEKLHLFADQVPLLKNTVRVLCDYDVKTAEATHLIADLKRQKSELQRLAELGRWEKLLRDRQAPKKREKGTLKMTRTVREACFRNLTGLAKILPSHDSLAKLQITDPADVALWWRCWKDINAVVEKIKREGGVQ